MYCSEWAHQAAYNIPEDECRLYCCEEPTCAGYIYKGGWCAIGNNLDGCKPDNSYSGGSRPVPAATPPPPVNGPQTPSYNDRSWENVTVPHDYVVLQTPNPNDDWAHGYRPRNISWYRKHFVISPVYKGKVVYLEFDGVYRSSDMWLNGNFLGHHASGYTSFRYRLDNFPGVIYGANVLSVRLDPRAREGWWYEGAGIYRHTRIVVVDPVHISPWGVYIPSRIIGNIQQGTMYGVTGRFADSFVEMYTNVTNLNIVLKNTVSAYVRSYIVGPKKSPSPRIVWQGASDPFDLAVNAHAVIYQSATISHAALWDVEDPHLYTLVTEVRQASTNLLLDNTNTTFGVRKAHFDSQYGLYLNDRAVKVNGMCNHQDFAGVGTAVPDRVNKYRVESLQAMGVNAWRMSHNPPNIELLDFADELGMMIWDENRFFGQFSQWYTDLRDMLMRHRNHPSIIWWSLCNEWGCEQFDKNVTIKIGLKFRDVVKELDNRPISGAWNGDLSTGEAWGSQVVDIMGINYNYQNYDPFHTALPTIPLISSESCSCMSDRNNAANATDALVGPFNAWPCIMQCWQPVATRSFVIGSFDWTGFDYRGEESPTRWPAINSHFGAIDLSGFPKDDFYYLKAWFTVDQPVVHIVPDSWDEKGSGDDLFVFQCSGKVPSWKFVPANGKYLLQSETKAGYCVQGSNGYPGLLAPCNPKDSSFLFERDSYGQIFFMQNKNTKLCLDVYAGTGPQVGFWECKDQTNSNQDWTLNSSTGALANAGDPGYCLATGRQVLVYTNGDQVELYLNGAMVSSQGLKAFESGGFLLDYAPGNLTARVTKKGAYWGSDQVMTSGTPVRIVVEQDYPKNGGAIVSSGQDVALIRAYLVNSQGFIVKNVNNLLTFTVTDSATGRIVGTGNGDPSDHTPDQGNLRRVWNGLARAVVGANKSSKAGVITVRVTTPGLPAGQISITTVPM